MRRLARASIVLLGVALLPVARGGPSRASGPGRITADRKVVAVSVGPHHGCGILDDGAVRCWGCRESAVSDTPLLPGDEGQCTPPDGRFTQVSAGYGQTCGVRADGTVACWGSNASGCATPPEGEFLQVCATRYRTCGLREGGTLAC